MKAIRTGLLVALAATAGVSVALSADLFHSRWSDVVSVEQATDILPAEVLDSPAAEALAPQTDGAFPDLLRIPDVEMSVAPTVSQDVLTSGTVRKIGFGRIETVNIVVTSTGTYSSDAMDTTHVIYPGIETGRKDDATVGDFFLALIDGRWSPMTPVAARSVVQYGTSFGTSYRIGGDSTCIFGANYSNCLQGGLRQG